jgi:lipopolysaccharide export system protein LptA
MLLAPSTINAQVTTVAVDTLSKNIDSNKVQILGSDRLTLLKTDDTTTLQILAGNVKLKQGNAYFFCDSCVLNNSANIFEAWNNVRLKDSDSINVYAKHLVYRIDKKLANLDGGVRLTDGKATLSTPDLEYDMNTDIGTYKKGGRVVNKKTVLTSDEGYYYASLKDIYFKKNVVLKDPAYQIKTDSLLYNTGTQTNRFIAQTFIKDSSGRTIETKEGFYNTVNGKAEFGKRPIIKDGATTVIGDRVAFNDSLGTSQAAGNVIVTDTAQGTTLLAGEMFRDNKKDRMLATGKPLMIIKQDNDSIYLAADTIYSSRHEDKDSTLRYIEAFHHVRIFSDSLQGVSDSLYYSYKDSTFRLLTDPVLWSNGNQITGDTIWLHTKNKKADRLKVFENSMMVSQVEPGVYNQITSVRMDGYFTAGSLDSVRALGYAECIYFLQDEDSAYTGINESKSEIIDIYIVEKALDKVVFRSEVTGTIWPIQQKNPGEMRLPNFIWLDQRRPKTKWELFE